HREPVSATSMAEGEPRAAASVREVLPAAVGDEGAGGQAHLPGGLTIPLDPEHDGLVPRNDRDAGLQDEGRERAPDSAFAGAGTDGAERPGAEGALTARTEWLPPPRRRGPGGA